MSNGNCTETINNQGGHYSMSLLTGKYINIYHWEELPINDKVIIKVKKLLETEKQPNLVDGMPIFEQILDILIYDKEGDMGEIIQNVEHVHTNFIEE